MAFFAHKSFKNRRRKHGKLLFSNFVVFPSIHCKLTVCASNRIGLLSSRLDW